MIIPQLRSNACGPALGLTTYSFIYSVPEARQDNNLIPTEQVHFAMNWALGQHLAQKSPSMPIFSTSQTHKEYGNETPIIKVQSATLGEVFMEPELYNKEILRLAANIPNVGRLEGPDATATKTSRICGSRVIVDINVKDGVITEFRQEPKACALGQASCALAGDLMVGQTAESFEKVTQSMLDMLKNEGPPPSGDWECFKIFEPARDITSRHDSIMLPFNAVMDALKKCC